MYDRLGTGNMKLGSHPNYFCNFVYNTTFVENIYLYVLSSHLYSQLWQKYQNFMIFEILD